MYVSYCFLNLSSLCPDVGDHQSSTVSPEGVLEDMGQLWLSVGNVFTSLVCQCSNHLLQKRERFVDVESFTLDTTCRLLDNKINEKLNCLLLAPTTSSCIYRQENRTWYTQSHNRRAQSQYYIMHTKVLPRDWDGEANFYQLTQLHISFGFDESATF